MADFYKRQDVQALLKNRKILFLGDSNVRPFYKDLIYAIKHKELISVKTLKNPNVDSYCGDIAIQQCGRKHEWLFCENRLFEEGPWRVEMFCTGSVMISQIQHFISKLPEIPSSIPDIVYISYNSSYGINVRQLVPELLLHIKMRLPCNTLIVVGSSFPTARDMFGNPLYDEVPFLLPQKRGLGMDEDILVNVLSLGFHYLNVSHYLRRDVFRDMTTTEPGWESVIVRYTTFLLLTYIAKTLMIKTPNRVNQDVLLKAMSSSNYERDVYNNLLLKHANNWLGVKANALSEEINLAASNAYEITQVLWKINNCSQSHNSIKCKAVSKSKNKHNYGRGKRDKGSRNSALSPGSSRSISCDKENRRNPPSVLEAASSYDAPQQKVTKIPCKTFEHQQNDRADKQRAHENPIAEPLENTGMKTSFQDDEESLEEGEIRESPGVSPKRQEGVCADINVTVLSDLSDSDQELDSPTSPILIPDESIYHHLDYHHHHHPSYINGYQSYLTQNYGMPVLASNAVLPQQQTQFTDFAGSYPVVTIDLSDGEPTQEENPNDECIVIDEAIINLDSEEYEDDSPRCTKTTKQANSCHENSKAKQESYGGRTKLRLLNEQGTLIRWPTDVARAEKKETLWRWWRTLIESSSGSLVLYEPDMGHVHGMVPTTNKKPHIAVPKIVDDMHQFLKCLADIQFLDYRSDLNAMRNNDNERFHNLNKNAVMPMKLRPLAEELTRGSVHRISFTIKKKSQLPAARNRITIKEFASIRNWIAKNKKYSNWDKSCEPTAFYSYGETPNIKIPSSDRPLGSSHIHLNTNNSNTESRKSDKESTRRSLHDKISNDNSHGGKKNTWSSITSKSSSKETRTKRRRYKSSSSSDRSPLRRDRRHSQRHRHKDQSSGECDRYRDESPSHCLHRYKCGSYSGQSTSTSQDSSPSRLG